MNKMREYFFGTIHQTTCARTQKKKCENTPTRIVLKYCFQQQKSWPIKKITKICSILEESKLTKMKKTFACSDQPKGQRLCFLLHSNSKLGVLLLFGFHRVILERFRILLQTSKSWVATEQSFFARHKPSNARPSHAVAILFFFIFLSRNGIIFYFWTKIIMFIFIYKKKILLWYCF